jgi:polysaccharide pyruvyl transferase WcaK-like protein
VAEIPELIDADDLPPRPKGLWDRVGKRLRDAAGKAYDKAAEVTDPDVLLLNSMGALVDLAGTRYALDPGAQWKPGQPLKLLFAGYSGTRNTGADVRVEEMIRQVRHLLGDLNCELSITTIDPELSRGYFRTVTQLHLPQIFPRFVFDTVHDVHGVIACEGSMFKSKFANALSTFMVGSLGCAAAENKLSVAYGGEAGAMDPALKKLVAKHCSQSLVICRNEASRDVLGALGVPTESGTDTAWTFEPAPAEVGERMLRDAGWDGHKKVLAIAPINAFWWPVKPDVAKGLAHFMTGAYDQDHYSSVYFHRSGDDVDKAQEAYLRGIADGLARFQADHDVFVVLVGMEKLDRRACDQLCGLIGRQLPMFVSDDYDMYEMVSLLRRCSMLLSSRYHAIVCSMPGLVASAGVTMDERIANLMEDRGTPELALKVDQPALGRAVYTTLERLDADAEALKSGIAKTVVENLERMGRMGQVFVDHLRARHPEFPIREGLGMQGSPWDHLPPLSPEVQALLASGSSETR